MTKVQQLGWLLRAWWHGPARAAFRQVYPSYALLLLVAALLFGGNGLQPGTVVNFARTMPWGGTLLLTSWVAISSRAYRAALLDPGFLLLRTFPLPSVSHALVGLTFVWLVECPWLVMWAIGGGVRQAAFALCGSLMGSYLWIGTSRMRFRFLPTLETARPLPMAVTAFLRTLVRRYTQGVLLGVGSWVAVTAVVMAMFRREHESLATKIDFGSTTFSLCAVILSTTSLWLLHQDEQRVKWLFLSIDGGSRLMVTASVTTALVLGVGLGVLGCFTTLLLVPLEIADVTLPLLCRTVSSGMGFGLLAAGLLSWWLRRKRRSRAPLTTLLSVVPLVLLVDSGAAFGVGMTFAAAVVGLVLLRTSETKLVDQEGDV